MRQWGGPLSACAADGASVRHRILRRLGDERGIALVLALGIMLVLVVALTSTVYMTSSSGRHANVTNAGQRVYALAETGLNNAIAVLHAHYPDTTNAYPGDRCVLNAQLVPVGFPGTAPRR